MTLSEKLEEVKFTKSVAGYAQKEVDGFIADILPLVREQEQIISALRVKLEAFEGQGEEIMRKEREARALLEAAKQESEIIIATAKKSADDIAAEARVASEVQIRAASTRAADTIANAESQAAARVSEAEATAEKIIATADAKGRELLEKVRAIYDAEEKKAKALVNECAAFEARFRNVVASTVESLAKINSEAPVTPDVKSEESVKVEQVSVPPEETVEEKVEEENVPVVTPAHGEPRRRKLYDTVNVTYENDEDDDFSDIKSVMKGKGIKGPTDFSE